MISPHFVIHPSTQAVVELHFSSSHSPPAEQPRIPAAATNQGSFLAVAEATSFT